MLEDLVEKMDRQHAWIDRVFQQRDGNYKKESNDNGNHLKHSNEECLSWAQQ